MLSYVARVVRHALEQPQLQSTAAMPATTAIAVIRKCVTIDPLSRLQTLMHSSSGACLRDRRPVGARDVHRAVDRRRDRLALMRRSGKDAAAALTGPRSAERRSAFLVRNNT